MNFFKRQTNDWKRFETVDLAILNKSSYHHITYINQQLSKLNHCIKQGNLLNTNADTIAAEAAKALAKHFEVTIVFCFEKKGVLMSENDDDSVIAEITQASFDKYVAEGIIKGGMIPKLENSFDASFSRSSLTLLGRNLRKRSAEYLAAARSSFFSMVLLHKGE